MLQLQYRVKGLEEGFLSFGTGHGHRCFLIPGMSAAIGLSPDRLATPIRRCGTAGEYGAGFPATDSHPRGGVISDGGACSAGPGASAGASADTASGSPIPAPLPIQAPLSVALVQSPDQPHDPPEPVDRSEDKVLAPAAPEARELAVPSPAPRVERRPGGRPEGRPVILSPDATVSMGADAGDIAATRAYLAPRIARPGEKVEIADIYTRVHEETSLSLAEETRQIIGILGAMTVDPEEKYANMTMGARAVRRRLYTALERLKEGGEEDRIRHLHRQPAIAAIFAGISKEDPGVRYELVACLPVELRNAFHQWLGDREESLMIEHYRLSRLVALYHQMVKMRRIAVHYPPSLPQNGVHGVDLLRREYNALGLRTPRPPGGTMVVPEMRIVSDYLDAGGSLSVIATLTGRSQDSVCRRFIKNAMNGGATPGERASGEAGHRITNQGNRDGQKSGQALEASSGFGKQPAGKVASGYPENHLQSAVGTHYPGRKIPLEPLENPSKEECKALLERAAKARCSVVQVSADTWLIDGIRTPAHMLRARVECVERKLAGVSGATLRGRAA